MDAHPISQPGGRRPRAFAFAMSPPSAYDRGEISPHHGQSRQVCDCEGVHMRNLSLIAILCLGASASIAAGAASGGSSGGGHSSGGSVGGSAGGSHSSGVGVQGGNSPHVQRAAAGAGGTAVQTRLSADFKEATITHATIGGKPVQLATLKCPPLSDHAKKVLRSRGWIEYFPEQNQPYYCHDRERSDPRFGERDCFRIVN